MKNHEFTMHDDVCAYSRNIDLPRGIKRGTTNRDVVFFLSVKSTHENLISITTSQIHELEAMDEIGRYCEFFLSRLGSPHYNWFREMCKCEKFGFLSVEQHRAGLVWAKPRLKGIAKV